MKKSIILMIGILMFAGILCAQDGRLKTKLVFSEKNDPKYSLPGPALLFLDGDANIYLSAGDGTIRKYDKDGLFLKQFAGKGQGPGEISFISGANVIGNKIFILDLYRKHIFGVDGKLVKTAPVVKSLYTPRYAKFIDENSWVMIGDSYMETDVPGQLDLLACRRNGKDTNRIFQIGCPELNAYKNIRSYDGTYLNDILMDADAKSDIIYAQARNYKIWKYASGKSSLLISENPSPEAVPEKIKSWAKSIERPGYAVVLPEKMNLMTNIQFDSDGNIWVLTYSKEFKGLKKYNGVGKYLAAYVPDLKADYDRIFMKSAAGYLFFAIYDEEKGQKVFRADIR